MSESASVHALWLGLTAYEKSLEFQKDLLERCQKHHQAYLLGLEHPPTITLGKRAQAAVDVVWNESQLLESQLQVHSVDRGGEATLHAPGQLVIYPVLHLPRHRLKVKDYIQLLIDITRRSLETLGVKTDCSPQEPGLFTPQGKLVAFGLRIQKGVSQHGLSINCHNDLNLFESIRSCGVKSQKWTHLKAEGVNLSPRDLFKIWHRQFLLTRI